MLESSPNIFSFKIIRQKFRSSRVEPILINVLAAFLFVILAVGCGEKISDGEKKTERVKFLNTRADSLQIAGDYIHSLDTLLSAYRLIDGDSSIQADVRLRTYFLLGRTYSIYEDSEAATRYYNLAIELADKISDSGTLLKTYNNIFAAYTDQKYFEKADSINESMKAIETADTVSRTFHYLFNKGFLSSRKNENTKAIGEFQETLDFIRAHDSLRDLRIYPYSEMAVIYSRTRQNDSAYKYLRLFEEMSDDAGQPYVKVSALREMMLWAAKTGNASMASEYLDKYFTYTDSLINLQAFLKAKENIRRYEDESSRNKIDDMSVQLSSRHRWIINLSFLLILTLLICAFAIWRSITVNRTNKILYSKNVELAKTEAMYRELLLTQSKIEDHEDQTEVTGQADSPGNLELLEKIIREMEEHRPYLDAEYSLQTLANSVDSNTKYVSQVINENLGKNFRGFINEYRIREAEDRLKDTERYGHLTIQAIAESVGIKSKSTFVAAFKKVTGLTPSVYIKMAGKEYNNK